MAFACPALLLLQKPPETPRSATQPEPPGVPREAEHPVGSRDGSSRSLCRLHPVREPVPTPPSRFRGRYGASAAIFRSCVPQGGSTRAGMVARVAVGPLPGSRVWHSPGGPTRTCRMNPSSPLAFSPLKSPKSGNQEVFSMGKFCLQSVDFSAPPWADNWQGLRCTFCAVEPRRLSWAVVGSCDRRAGEGEGKSKSWQRSQGVVDQTSRPPERLVQRHRWDLLEVSIVFVCLFIIAEWGNGERT
ncbi:PREDICTED: LOW QUALITY PROTEIN: uncharacterized protein LOC108538693 [Rhinopithecus bieti]|uniref:LOW QUALITY PROTEIN: uncharacterized protein LOC108538693 n=1 Tax=Rhinopithecus bieti TaxID=61621 RepID=UPI00083C03EC|nr:PREDICTED: LOW QUALITY PROTEIN: uncharacterized protein LOC108538693 [Rhinopithecus bieti]